MAAYRIVKPFLSTHTQQKVQVFSYDATTWKNAILAEVPEDSLAIEFGGTGPSMRDHEF